MLLTGTAAIASPADQAARISRAIAAATPDPLTLAQLQHGIHELTTRYAVTPHADLVAPIERAWTDAETLLDTRITGPTRTDLELVAGQYAYYRGQFAFDMGDNNTALTFLVLAAQHADAASDTLLAGSVMVMRSAVVIWSRSRAVFHVCDGTSGCRDLPGGRGYLPRSAMWISGGAGVRAAGGGGVVAA